MKINEDVIRASQSPPTLLRYLSGWTKTGMGPLETVVRQYKWPHRMIFCSETKSLYYKSTRQLEYLDSFPTRIAEQNVAYPRIAIGSAET